MSFEFAPGIYVLDLIHYKSTVMLIPSYRVEAAFMYEGLFVFYKLNFYVHKNLAQL